MAPPPVSPIPKPEPTWPVPKLNIRVDDLSHEGAVIFFDSVRPTKALREAVLASFKWLYTPETVPTYVESILLVLRSMDGVAYTTGTHTHKEIHFSLDHIKRSASRAHNEIMGVLVHEVVHCFQYNAIDTCPGGLIEGVADYVRLHSDLVPPHWTRTGGRKWDAGYQTTAYFLDWIEEQHGRGIVQQINACMKDRKYHKHLFRDITGVSVGKLWKMYCAHLDGHPIECVNTADSSEGSDEES
ncbi:hypothetical protein BD779DRAFT_71319 [Infundibulicybe gibba]|nr:hypothetical protein BD779DRAFT_71319 [Infundibulicybe gibba]